jgi:hypothetical protein
MPKARIVISFDDQFSAENKIDDVRQLFMRRNPMDEPDIYIEIEEAETGKWVDTRIR